MGAKAARHHRQQTGTVKTGDAEQALPARQAAGVLTIGLAFGLGVIYEWGPLNGIWDLTHWEWPWRDLDPFAMGLALLAPFLCIGLVVWRLDHSANPARSWRALAVLALANFSLQILGTLPDYRGLEFIRQIVTSPGATSYFTDALQIQHAFAWMSNFHQAALAGHSSTHPAGPVLFYYVFIKIFGASTGALIGGCAVGLVASSGVWIIYKFAELWTPDPRARLLASAFYALLPALTVFFPEFDQVYPIFSMLLILSWVGALTAAPLPLRGPLYFGAVLFVATFFAYNILAIGAFVVYYGVYWLWRQGWTGSAVSSLVRTAGIALGVFAGLYLLLWLTTGYNAAAAFRHAVTNQLNISRALNRPYGPFAIMDPYDFALGAGIICVPLLLLDLKRCFARWKADRGAALTLIGLATILTVDLSGLLRGETTRVWIFLQPLVVVPTALQLVRTPGAWRVSIFTVQWWILVCLRAKMAFLEP